MAAGHESDESIFVFRVESLPIAQQLHPFYFWCPWGWELCQSQALRTIVSTSECRGSHPSRRLIFSELATSTAESPGRRGDSTALIARPLTLRAMSITSRTLNPLPLPKLQISRECLSSPSSASRWAVARSAM